MNENNTAFNLMCLLQSLDTLQESLMSSAHSLDNIAIQLENQHINSHDAEVLEAEQIAASWIARIRERST